jgi:hypothetical protein
MLIFGAGEGRSKEDNAILLGTSKGNSVLVEGTFEDSKVEFVKRFIAFKGSVDELVERL